MTDIKQLVEIIIGSALTIIGFFVARTIEKLEGTLKEVSKSMDELNTRVAVVIEKTLVHEKTIDNHAERIRSLEIEK